MVLKRTFFWIRNAKHVKFLLLCCSLLFWSLCLLWFGCLGLLRRFGCFLRSLFRGLCFFRLGCFLCCSLLYGFLCCSFFGDLAFFGLAAFFAGFFFFASPRRKDPEAPVPFDCFKEPFLTPAFNANFKWLLADFSSPTL